MYLVNCRMLKVYIDIGYEVLLIKQNDAVYIEYIMFFSSIYQPYLMSINMKTYLSYTLFCSALAREQASRSQKRLRVKNEFLPRYCKMVTFTLNGNTHSLQGKNLFKEEHIHHESIYIMYICKFRWRSKNFPDDPCSVHQGSCSSHWNKSVLQ